MKLLILCAAFFSTHLLAQYQLEKIIYTDSTSDSSSSSSSENESEISVLDEESIKEANPASIDDILRASPTATTSRGPRNSSESIQIRGLDPSKIFISVDGARQNFRGGHTSMIPVDLENLKAIEVFKSPGDLSKSNSLGGGIQFVTKDPEDYLAASDDFGSEFKYQNNSANAENVYNAKSVFKTNKYSGLLSLTRQKAHNTQLNNGQVLPNSAYEDFVGFIKVKHNAWTLSHESFHREDNNPLDPSLDPPNSILSLQADSEMAKQNTVLRYNKNLLDLGIYHTRFETEKTQREDQTREKRSIHTTGASFLKKIGKIRFGGEAFADRLDSEKKGSDISSFPKASSLNVSAFAEKHFGEGVWTVTPGLRINHYSMESPNEFRGKAAQELSKKLKLKYELGKETFLFASYSEGFNAPKVSEVYPSGLHSPGDGWIVRDNYFIPNLDLKHETSKNAEFGFLGQQYFFDYQGLVSFEASVYENKIRDYIKINRIDRSTMDEEDGTSQFVNVPKVTLYGGEARLKVIYDIFEWKLAYSQVRGKNESDDLYLEDLPADQYTYAFNLYLDRYRAKIGYLGIQAQEQNRINPETLQRTEKTPGYFIHNIYGQKDIGEHFELGLRIDNLGNQEYRRHGSFLYETKEDYKLTFKYKVKTL